MIGSDAGGDRFIVEKSGCGPVYKFDHESNDFGKIIISDSLIGFVKICNEIQSSKNLDIKVVGKDAFIKEYQRIRSIIEQNNMTGNMGFWSSDFTDIEEFWDENGEYTGP